MVAMRSRQLLLNMLATLRIEKLGPSESLKPAIQAYVDGNKSTSDLLNEVKAKYVALRSR